MTDDGTRGRAGGQQSVAAACAGAKGGWVQPSWAAGNRTCAQCAGCFPLARVVSSSHLGQNIPRSRDVVSHVEIFQSIKAVGRARGAVGAGRCRRGGGGGKVPGAPRLRRAQRQAERCQRQEPRGGVHCVGRLSGPRPGTVLEQQPGPLEPWLSSGSAVWMIERRGWARAALNWPHPAACWVC